MTTFCTFPARELKLKHYGVVVCGSGPAGVSAALAAARAGAKVLLIEAHGCLGGVWTSGNLTWIIDSENKPGLMKEFVDELNRRRATTKRNTAGFSYNPEIMKQMLEDLCGDADVDILLHTRVVGASRDGNNRLQVVFTENKSGAQAWSADEFIDATGDGDLGFYAGCGFDLGKPLSGECQPMSLLAIIGGIHQAEISDFIGGGESKPKARLFEELCEAGVEPSYGSPTLFPIQEGLFTLMANHEYGVPCDDAQAITQATVSARREVNRLVDGLRKKGGIWKDINVVNTSEQIGVREGRRIHGHYTVSKEDLIEGRRHSDAVCRVTFKMDVHSTNKRGGTSYEPENVARTQHYDIPLRALIAKDVDGLLMAGRCISGDFYAHSSYRVSGNAVSLGQAAGLCAALASANQCLPQDIKFEILQTAAETIFTPQSKSPHDYKPT